MDWQVTTPLTRRADSLARVARDVVVCEACPRLRRYCTAVASRGKPEFAGWTYWGRPVPGFGDPEAALLVIGLAPAAHGGNRTGRMFTGDGSATWLVRAMYRAGFANQPTSTHRGDGLELRGAYMTAPVRCAPPENRPARDEFLRCLPFLEREVALLTRVRVLVALGRLAFDVCRRLLRVRGAEVPALGFEHGACYEFGGGIPALIASYHPSRQNTNTGKLTQAMLDDVFRTARRLVDPPRRDAGDRSASTTRVMKTHGPRRGPERRRRRPARPR